MCGCHLGSEGKRERKKDRERAYIQCFQVEREIMFGGRFVSVKDASVPEGVNE